MRISVFYVKISHQLFLEAWSNGNCRCEPSNLLTRSNLSLGTPFGHALPRSAMSLLVIALNFARVVTVLDVPLSIPVTSVRVPTEWVFVLFVPIQSSYQDPLPMAGPHGPNPHLPTPIKFNRLLYLSSGYNHSTVIFLSNGFTRGFPYIFKGSASPRRPKICYQLHRIHPLLMQKLLKNLQLVVWLVPLFLPLYPPLLFLPSVWFPKNHQGNFGLFTICRFQRVLQ